MKIAITGASGFIGTHLADYFSNMGNEIFPLHKGIFQKDTDMLKQQIQGSNIIINLAGAPINHRWTKAYKKQMYDSRIFTTRKLVNAINSVDNKPSLLISASAVGYYADTGCHDEQSLQKAEGFLSGLCQEWENEARKVSPEVRLAITRFGVVLSKTGGAFPKLRLPSKFKTQAILGTGQQLFPWISLYDLTRAIEFIIQNPEINGVVNMVASSRINHREVMRSIAKYDKTLFKIIIPEFLMRWAMGEASTFLTKGQCVIPKKLTQSGFIYQTPDIDSFIQSIKAD